MKKLVWVCFLFVFGVFGKAWAVNCSNYLPIDSIPGNGNPGIDGVKPILQVTDSNFLIYARKRSDLAASNFEEIVARDLNLPHFPEIIFQKYQSDSYRFNDVTERAHTGMLVTGLKISSQQGVTNLFAQAFVDFIIAKRIPEGSNVLGLSTYDSTSHNSPAERMIGIELGSNVYPIQTGPILNVPTNPNAQIFGFNAFDVEKISPGHPEYPYGAEIVYGAYEYKFIAGAAVVSWIMAFRFTLKVTESGGIVVVDRVHPFVVHPLTQFEKLVKDMGVALRGDEVLVYLQMEGLQKRTRYLRIPKAGWPLPSVNPVQRVPLIPQNATPPDVPSPSSPITNQQIFLGLTPWPWNYPIATVEYTESSGFMMGSVEIRDPNSTVGGAFSAFSSRITPIWTDVPMGNHTAIRVQNADLSGFPNQGGKFTSAFEYFVRATDPPERMILVDSFLANRPALPPVGAFGLDLVPYPEAHHPVVHGDHLGFFSSVKDSSGAETRTVVYGECVN